MISKKVQFTDEQIKWLSEERTRSGYSANVLIRMAVEAFIKVKDKERSNNGK